MTDRRLAPLTALSTLTRRPARAELRIPPTGPASAPSAGPSRVIDNAVYSDGRRVVTPAIPYERPALSKEYLAGEKTSAKLLLRSAAFWAEREVDLRLGARVVEVDPSTPLGPVQ